MYSLEFFRRFIDKQGDALDLNAIAKANEISVEELKAISKDTKIGHTKFHDLKKSLAKYGYSDFLYRNSNDPLSIVMTFWAVKGGSGKTTLTKFIGYALAYLGYKVLLIDNDHQCNLTQQFIEVKPDYETTTILDLYQTDLMWEPISIESSKIDFIPAVDSLASARAQIANKAYAQTRLAKALEPYRYDYDYILIDSRPDKKEIMVDNSLTAADYIFMPLLPDLASLSGIDKGYEEVQEIRTEFNLEVKIGGMILNQFQANTNVSNMLKENLKEEHPDDLLDSVIHYTVEVKNQSFLAEDVFNVDKKSKFKGEILSLATEIIKRTK